MPWSNDLLVLVYLKNKIDQKSNDAFQEELEDIQKGLNLENHTIKELRERQYYEKPSAKKRRKKKENIANVKKLKKKLERLRGY